MNVHTQLIQTLEKHIALLPEEKKRITNSFSQKEFKKRTSILDHKQHCHYLSYVSSGCTKIYSIDAEGIEHIIFFSPEDWWAVDLHSFLSGEKSRFCIDTIEDTVVLQISKTDFEALLNDIPKLEKWFRILLQNALIASENRIHHKMSLTAEERYYEFHKKYPQLETRIPQKQIASFLGVTPEFLSKLRAQRWKQQNS